MVVDTSAIIEIIQTGDRWRDVRNALVEPAAPKFISAVSWVEAHIVVTRKSTPAGALSARQDVDRLLLELGILVEPVSVTHAQLAIEAFAKFGQGAGGGALNFGDCFSYALAKQRNHPLLFVGDDFRRTDIASVL